MKLLSLFDGEGGFPLAGVMCGIEPVYASEIEPFPIAVTRSRFPNMKHLGNVSEVNGAKLEPVDVVTFGSPCQDMSVAGKRAGLKHDELGDEETTRSGLFFESIRIIKEMRLKTNGRYPRFAVWENVPGAFSSNGGRDFLAVLQAFASVREPSVSIPEPARSGKSDGLTWLRSGCIVGNGWSIVWRTLDAQYWGVPQRRNRIYLVADFSSERAEEILFERYSLRGNSSQSGETRERITEDVTRCVDGSLGIECLNPWDCQSKRVFLPEGVYPTLPAMDGGGANNQAVVYPTVGFDRYNGEMTGDVTQTLAGTTCDNNVPHVIAFAQNQRDEVRDLNGIAGSIAAEAGTHQQTFIAQPVIALQANGIDRADTAGCNGAGWREDQSYTLNTVDRHAVVYPEIARTLERRYDSSPCIDRGQETIVQSCYPDISGTIAASGAGTSRPAGQGNETDLVVVEPNGKKYIVRRLMPVETLRLQGYPDWWHDLAPFDGDVDFWESVRKTWAEINGKRYRPFKSVEQLEKWYNGLRTDAAEYKADGNSLAIPCAAYVMRRIKEFAE